MEYAETEDKKREESESDVNQTAELCDADTVESSLPPDSRQKRLADLQAERAACDPAHLQGIKVRTFVLGVCFFSHSSVVNLRYCKSWPHCSSFDMCLCPLVHTFRYF